MMHAIFLFSLVAASLRRTDSAAKETTESSPTLAAAEATTAQAVEPLEGMRSDFNAALARDESDFIVRLVNALPRKYFMLGCMLGLIVTSYSRYLPRFAVAGLLASVDSKTRGKALLALVVANGLYYVSNIMNRLEISHSSLSAFVLAAVIAGARQPRNRFSWVPTRSL